MPASCGHCNLQCYLCLRRVNPFDGTCRLHSTGGALNTSEVCSDSYGMGGNKNFFFFFFFYIIYFSLFDFIYMFLNKIFYLTIVTEVYLVIVHTDILYLRKFILFFFYFFFYSKQRIGKQFH